MVIQVLGWLLQTQGLKTEYHRQAASSNCPSFKELVSKKELQKRSFKKPIINNGQLRQLVTRCENSRLGFLLLGLLLASSSVPPLGLIARSSSWASSSGFSSWDSCSSSSARVSSSWDSFSSSSGSSLGSSSVPPPPGPPARVPSSWGSSSGSSSGLSGSSPASSSGSSSWASTPGLSSARSLPPGPPVPPAQVPLWASARVPPGPPARVPSSWPPAQSSIRVSPPGPPARVPPPGPPARVLASWASSSGSSSWDSCSSSSGSSSWASSSGLQWPPVSGSFLLGLQLRVPPPGLQLGLSSLGLQPQFGFLLLGLPSGPPPGLQLGFLPSSSGPPPRPPAWVPPPASSSGSPPGTPVPPARVPPPGLQFRAQVLLLGLQLLPGLLGSSPGTSSSGSSFLGLPRFLLLGPSSGSPPGPQFGFLSSGSSSWASRVLLLGPQFGFLSWAYTQRSSSWAFRVPPPGPQFSSWASARVPPGPPPGPPARVPPPGPPPRVPPASSSARVTPTGPPPVPPVGVPPPRRRTESYTYLGTAVLWSDQEVSRRSGLTAGNMNPVSKNIWSLTLEILLSLPSLLRILLVPWSCVSMPFVTSSYAGSWGTAGRTMSNRATRRRLHRDTSPFYTFRE
nr:basic proline-rich protein-like [Penaeus vannamei]